MNNKQNKFLINTDMSLFPILNELSWMKSWAMSLFKGDCKLVHVLIKDKQPCRYVVLQYIKGMSSKEDYVEVAGFDLDYAIIAGHNIEVSEKMFYEILEFVKECDKTFDIFLPTENDLICKDYEEALKELTLRAFKDDRLVYNEDWYK